VTCGVYRITFPATGDQYVGASYLIEKRWLEHRCFGPNRRFRALVKKYGVDSFVLETLEECPKAELALKESAWRSKLCPSLNINFSTSDRQWKANKTIKICDGLGTQMEQARKRKGVSVAQLCRNAEISRNYWYAIVAEQVRGMVEEPTFRRIEAALDADFKVQFNDEICRAHNGRERSLILLQTLVISDFWSFCYGWFD
jgi:transcriptional regulator with XRE-family HTH domain